jgi:HlyD family secretion protein
MQLESRGQQDLLRQENEVRQLAVQVEAAEANLTELRKVRDLIASSSFIKEETELEKLKLQLSEAKERFDVSRQEMGLAKKGAQSRGGIVTIRAPRNGIITLIDKRPGDYVGSGAIASDGTNDRTVMVIADLTRLMVRTRVMEADLRYVKQGLPVSVKLEAYPDSQYQGKVLITGGQGRTDKTAGYTYFDVDVSLDSPDARVLPEMNATVDLTFDRRDNALSLPVAAVAIFPERSVVMKQDPNDARKFIETPVKTGLVNETDVEILSGLNEGDKVQEIDFATIIPESGPNANVRVGRKGKK